MQEDISCSQDEEGMTLRWSHGELIRRAGEDKVSAGADQDGSPERNKIIKFSNVSVCHAHTAIGGG